MGNVRFVLPCPQRCRPPPVGCESGKNPGRRCAAVAVPAGGGTGRRLAGNVLSWCWLRCGRSHHQHAGGRGIRKLGNVVWFRPTVRAALAGVELAFLLPDATGLSDWQPPVAPESSIRSAATSGTVPFRPARAPDWSAPPEAVAAAALRRRRSAAPAGLRRGPVVAGRTRRRTSRIGHSARSRL